MLLRILVILLVLVTIFLSSTAKHFNGGTISWAPINPYDNDSSVDITITQTYYWTYPYVQCANNVPISTAKFSGANANLACVVDCTTDGGYSAAPLDILTDCISSSVPLGMLTGVRPKNKTLTANAHFYVAYTGSAWVGLNYPSQSGLQWSIVAFIDLRKRPDGFINTSPVASVISPQYAIVNRTTQINIPVSDANAGDDVRCRWSTYTTGLRKRKRSDEENYIKSTLQYHLDEGLPSGKAGASVRRKRYGHYSSSSCSCYSSCSYGCACTCSVCYSTTCTGSTCGHSSGCAVTTVSSSPSSTTLETIPTLKSTLSYVTRQALDECGGICFPNSMPTGTTLSNCTITFTPTKVGVWYAVAIQASSVVQ